VRVGPDRPERLRRGRPQRREAQVLVEDLERYQVVSNLVRNPRCPIAISLGLVPRLNPREMKALAVDRNVPEAVRKHAQKFIRQPGR